MQAGAAIKQRGVFVDPGRGDGLGRAARAEVAALRRLARECGVQDVYTDTMGARRVASAESLLAVLRCMGVPLERVADAESHRRRLASERAERLCEPVLVMWLGLEPPAIATSGAGKATQIVLEEENGRRRAWSSADGMAARLPPDIDVGVHTLVVSRGGREERATLLVAPRRCRQVAEAVAQPGNARGAPRAPTVGAFLPLYAAHSQESAGIGDLSDPEALTEWAGLHECRLFGTLPLLACFLDEPLEPSPYAPISRRVFGEVFLDVGREGARASEEGASKEVQGLLDSPEGREAMRRVRSGETVEYAQVWAFKRRLLAKAARAAFANERMRQEIEEFERAAPIAARYARFRGAMARLGTRGGVWRAWPEPARTGVLRDEDVDEAERRLFLYAQWRLQERLEEVVAAGHRAGCSLYMDLPIGVHADGFDVWERQELFAHAAQLGAPPDSFFAAGQAWGFPPVMPQASRAEGHAYFRECLSAHLRYAGALRIDHAPGLHRCFWVPEGMEPAEGVYVRQPAEELYAALCIESHRDAAAIIGENLGTVPREVNRSLRRRGVLLMRIAQFELGDKEDPLPRVGPGELCALNTHDLPTFAAFWSAADLELHVRLGLLTPEQAESERSGREAMRRTVVRALALTPAEADDPAHVARTLLAHLAGSRADVLLVNLEDLWAEMRPHNVPGVRYACSWRRRSARSIEATVADAFLGQVVRSLSSAGVPDGAGGGAGERSVRGERDAGSQER